MTVQWWDTGQHSSISQPSGPWFHGKVVVTGSRGFIGRAVVNQLESRGVEAIPFDLSDGHDIRDFGSVNDVLFEADAVIHLAGVLGTHELFDTPQLAVDANVTGTLNILRACHAHDLKYVGITMPQVFPSIYTATKIAATRLATAYHHTHGLQVSHVRAFNAFGPGQAHGEGHPQKIIPTFATNAWHGLPIPVWGDGSQWVDLIHTDQLALVIDQALGLPGDDSVYDGGTGRSQTVMDVVHEVCRIVGVPPLVRFLPMRRGETPTKIHAEGEGWDKLSCGRPKAVPLDDTVQWYRP